MVGKQGQVILSDISVNRDEKSVFIPFVLCYNEIH